VPVTLATPTDPSAAKPAPSAIAPAPASEPKPFFIPFNNPQKKNPREL
jgi:hypothetical protein